MRKIQGFSYRVIWRKISSSAAGCLFNCFGVFLSRHFFISEEYISFMGCEKFVIIVQSYITSLLPSVSLQVRSTSNNPNSTNKWYFSSIAWYYGDNDFIIWTFDFIARSDIHTRLVVPDRDSCVTCSKKDGFLWTVCSCKPSPLTPIHSREFDVW